jgi:hypothetical protein
MSTPATDPAIDAELSTLRKNFNELYGIKPKAVKEPDPEPEPAPADPPAAPDAPAQPDPAPAPAADPAPPEAKPEDQPAPAPTPAPAPAAPAVPAPSPIVAAVEPEPAATKPRQLPPEPEPAPAEPTKEDLRMEAIKRLEQEHPEHAGFSTRVANFEASRSAYVAKWSKDNPGSKFDWSDPEHEDWEEKNSPWNDRLDELFEEARIDVKLERRLTKERAEMDRKLNSIKDQERVKERKVESANEIAKSMAGSIVKLIKTVDQSFGEIVESGGKIDLSDAAVEKIRARDPMAADMLITEGHRVSVFVEESEKLVRFAGTDEVQFNPGKSVKLPNGERFYPHAEFAQFGADLEDDLEAAPATATTKGGRKWARASDLDAMETAVIKDKSLSKADKQAKLDEIAKGFWAISQREIVNAYVADRAEMVKKTLSKLKPATAAAPSGTPSPAAAAAGAAPAPATVKPAPVTSASASDRGGKAEPGRSGGKISKDQILKAQWG